MDLTTVREQTQPLDVPFGSETLHVTYRPHALLVRDMTAATSTPAESIDQACRALASWDLTDGGAAVPLTAEGLAGVPYDLLAAVLQAVAAEIAGPPAHGSSSSAT